MSENNPSRAGASPSGRGLSASKRAALVARHGEAYAADYERAYVAAYAQGFDEASKAVRERACAILAAPEAAGKTGAAKIIALETDMPVEAARSLLKSLGSLTGFAARMAGFEPLSLDPEPPSGGASGSQVREWGGIVDGLNREMGFKGPPDPNALYAARRQQGG